MAMKMSQKCRLIAGSCPCIPNKAVNITSTVRYTVYTGRLNFLPWKTLK
jgi:hypothetical protein